MKETSGLEELNELQNKFSPESGPVDKIQLISGNSTLFQGLNELATLYWDRVICSLQLVATLHFKGLNIKLEASLKEHARFTGRKILIMRCWHHPLLRQDISVSGISLTRIAKCAILSWEKEWHRFLTKFQSIETTESVFQLTDALQLLDVLITRWDAEPAAAFGEGDRAGNHVPLNTYMVLEMHLPIHSDHRDLLSTYIPETSPASIINFYEI